MHTASPHKHTSSTQTEAHKHNENSCRTQTHRKLYPNELEIKEYRHDSIQHMMKILGGRHLLRHILPEMSGFLLPGVLRKLFILCVATREQQIRIKENIFHRLVISAAQIQSHALSNTWQSDNSSQISLLASHAAYSDNTYTILNSQSLSAC